MIAVNYVHTSGVNWESIGVLAAIFGAMFSVLAFYIARRDKKQEDVKQQIADAINHQTEVLLAKLETKETVAGISNRLARLEGSIRPSRDGS